MASVIESLVEEYANPEGIARAYTVPQLPLIYLPLLPEDTDFKTYVRERFGHRLANPNSKVGFPSWDQYCNYLWYRFNAKCATHKVDIGDLEDVDDPLDEVNKIYVTLPLEETKTWTAGDLVFNGDDYRQNGVFIFTGDEVDCLDDDIVGGDYGSIPEQFKLLQYPPNYWRHYDDERTQVEKNGFMWLNNSLSFDPSLIDVTFQPEHVKTWEELSYVIFNHAGIHYCIAGFTDVAEVNQAQWLRLVGTRIDELTWGEAFPQVFMDFVKAQYNVHNDSVYSVFPNSGGLHSNAEEDDCTE